MAFPHFPTHREAPLPEKEENIDVEWARMIEVIKQETVENPIVTEVLLSIIAGLTDELLPLYFIESAKGQSNPIAQACDSSAGLMSLLVEPSNLHLEQPRKLGSFAEYDQEEAEEASTRIQFAKDLKILAAGTAFTLSPDRQRQLGLHVNLSEHASEYPSLLDPKEWKPREKIHSRVYVVEIGADKLILKERKALKDAPYDPDASEPANTSIDEVRITQELHDQIDYEGSGIKLSYETPVASVTFKDGYQFALFKYEEGLMDRDEAIIELTKVIDANFELYEEEYLEAKGIAKELEPKEYTELMATLLAHEGAAHLSEAVGRLGYRSDDGSQNKYRILQSEGKRPTLEIMGLDSEYHRKILESGKPYDGVAFSKIWGEQDDSEESLYDSASRAVVRVRRRRIK